MLTVMQKWAFVHAINFLIILGTTYTVGGQVLVGNPDPVIFDDEGAGRRLGAAKGKDGTCLDAFSLKKGSVVQVSKSEKLGGRLLNATTGLTSDECLKRCCQTEHCTAAAYEQQGRLACYLFNCGYVDDFRCELVPYNDYEVGILTTSREKLHASLKIQDLIKPESFRALLGRPDGHDNGGCTPFEFRCVTSGECIAGYDRCNGAYECPDRSDEANCDQQQSRTPGAGNPETSRNGDNRFLNNKNRLVQLEDEIRMSVSDENEQTLWDRGRNRPHTNPEPNTKLGSDKAGSSLNPPTDEWNFKPEAISTPASTTASQYTYAPHQKHTPSTSGTTVPVDKISTIMPIISSPNPHDHDVQKLHSTEKQHYGLPSWVNFSDPTHFVISVVLIIAVAFCVAVTVFVICRCICTRRPQVTKYRIVDPDAEDFLLGGSTYG